MATPRKTKRPARLEVKNFDHIRTFPQYRNSLKFEEQEAMYAGWCHQVGLHPDAEGSGDAFFDHLDLLAYADLHDLTVVDCLDEDLDTIEDEIDPSADDQQNN
jgi:hypothetical protein